MMTAAPISRLGASALSIRAALAEETDTLERLIAASARALGRGFYSDAETEALIEHVFGVDSELVADGTYLVVEDDSGVIACGGWSRRRTLFGGDRYVVRSSDLLDPAQDAARIRAFFVAPGQARRGIGSQLLDACEGAALAAGFTRMALMATLPGAPFYARHGYVAEPTETLVLGGTSVALIPMAKLYVADRTRI